MLIRNLTWTQDLQGNLYMGGQGGMETLEGIVYEKPFHHLII